MNPTNPRYAQLLAAVLPLTLAASAMAQLRPEPAAGIGRETALYNLNATLVLDQSYGCVYLGGEIFVSGDFFGSATPGPTIAVLDATTGNVLRTFAAPDNLRGGTTDGSNLMFVSTLGTVYVFDRLGNPVSTIETDNGTQTIPGNTVPLSLMMSASALAFDPSGNSGNGSFFTNSDLSDTPVIVEKASEHDLTGSLLQRYQAAADPEPC